MGALRDRAEELGIEVDGRWSNGTLTRKIAEVEARIADEEARANEPERSVVVKLLNHHRPLGWYEIVGHEDENGENVLDGSPMPAPRPGVEFAHKLWAGTIVKLAPDAAKRLVENTVAERVLDRDPVTREVIRVRQVERRKPLAEIMVDWAAQEQAGVEAAAAG